MIFGYAGLLILQRRLTTSLHFELQKWDPEDLPFSPRREVPPMRLLTLPVAREVLFQREARKENSTDLELPRALAPTANMHKVFAAIQEDPERFYQCIYIVDPEGRRPYCLAQEKTLTANECPYRIVMIQRSAAKAVVGTNKPHPTLLNIISLFQFNDSLFTVCDQPGLPLSEIAICHSPQLGLAQIQTISKEVRVVDLFSCGS
jgi:hypothetical protein